MAAGLRKPICECACNAVRDSNQHWPKQKRGGWMHSVKNEELRNDVEKDRDRNQVSSTGDRVGQKLAPASGLKDYGPDEGR